MILGILILIGYVLFTQVIKPSIDNRTITVEVPTTIKDFENKLGFTYLSGETAYTLIEPPVPPQASDGLKKIFIIMDTKKYQDFSASTDTKETPPTISLFILSDINNLDKSEEIGRLDHLKDWAERNSRYTSYSSKTSEPEVLELDGLKTLHYSVEGSYMQEVYLASYKERIYLFSGQYTSEDDEILNMYKDLISSITFY